MSRPIGVVRSSHFRSSALKVAPRAATRSLILMPSSLDLVNGGLVHTHLFFRPYTGQKGFRPVEAFRQILGKLQQPAIAVEPHLGKVEDGPHEAGERTACRAPAPGRRASTGAFQWQATAANTTRSRSRIF